MRVRPRFAVDEMLLRLPERASVDFRDFLDPFSFLVAVGYVDRADHGTIRSIGKALGVGGRLPTGVASVDGGSSVACSSSSLCSAISANFLSTFCIVSNFLLRYRFLCPPLSLNFSDLHQIAHLVNISKSGKE